MWKALFVVAALCVSASPLDAAPRDNGKRIEKTQRGDAARREGLRRDVERISQEIYRRGDPPRPRR